MKDHIDIVKSLTLIRSYGYATSSKLNDWHDELVSGADEDDDDDDDVEWSTDLSPSAVAARQAEMERQAKGVEASQIAEGGAKPTVFTFDGQGGGESDGDDRALKRWASVSKRVNDSFIARVCGHVFGSVF